MNDAAYLAGLTSESVNPRTARIDECSTTEMLRLLNEEDKLVPLAVEKELPAIAEAVEQITAQLRRGGRLFYIGCGTSGRLGVLDASECPPTYGTDPSLVQGYIAGGDTALRNAVEGSEDDTEAGRALIREKDVCEKDAVVGITASGSAPYVLGAIEEAKKAGAVTIGLATNKGSRLESLCDISIAPVVGPEPVMGSTRMKSGTAQKLVLNMLSTSVMIKLGKVYNNLMVDLRASNKKLRDRSIRIVAEAAEVSLAQAAQSLEAAEMQVKPAILMLRGGLSREEAESWLARCGGRLKEAIRRSAEEARHA